MPKTYIVLINYKNWFDTAECLESILKSDAEDYGVVIVDNNSENGSIERLKLWAEGKLDVLVAYNNPLRRLSFPPSEKPLSYVFYKETDIKNYSAGDISARESVIPGLGLNLLIFIQAETNNGFAAGNNIAVNYALKKDDFKYLWLLNNDTVVEKNSLANLLKKIENYSIKNVKVGITGSKIMFYDKPETIQGVGGSYNKLLASSRHIGLFEKDEGQYDNDRIIKKTDYIMGASMFVSKEFIKETGLMCEDYFLYFEELDWILRGREKGYDIGFAYESRIFHKMGSSAGSAEKGKEKSEISDYYSIKNRILFTKKFYPKFLWSVYLSFFAIFINRIKRGQWKRVKMVWSILKRRRP